MSNENISDLARMILNGDRIKSAMDVSKGAESPAGGTNLPQCAVPIMEGTYVVCNHDVHIPEGSVPTRFSKGEKIE